MKIQMTFRSEIDTFELYVFAGANISSQRDMIQEYKYFNT